MPRLGIIDLPEELVEYILRHVKDGTSPETFWNCLQTCHKLHRIGLGLYKGLGFAATVIIESNIRRSNVQQQSMSSGFPMSFHMDLHPPSQLYLSMLKSLTVHVQHRRVAVPSSLSARTDLITSLKDVLILTTRLTTFSLRFSDGWDFPIPDVPAIPQSLLAQVVEALPKTVIHLELDTVGIDVPPSASYADTDFRAHLCYQISRILRRLRRLRLRVGHVCDALLGFKSTDQGCHNQKNCGYCISHEHATCALLRSWKMLAMTIWLPRCQDDENELFIRASAPLLNPSLRNPAVILLVHQRNLEYLEYPWRPRDNYQSYLARTKFSWTPQSNVAKALSERLAYFTFTAITGISKVSLYTPVNQTSLPQQATKLSCIEHDLLCTRARLRFHISPSLGLTAEPGSTSPYPYMAEQTVENMLSWAQNTHKGYRFPIALSDELGKPFWKSEKIWACRFPGCGRRCETIVHLRGHHIYAHPFSPHGNVFNGHHPCRSYGCEKVGDNGFTHSRDLESHLLEHHLSPCTKAEGSAAIVGTTLD